MLNNQESHMMFIGGLPRSGTSMLLRVCNTHPDIQLTGELKTFIGINENILFYLRNKKTNWLRRQFLINKFNTQIQKHSSHIKFLLRYLIPIFLSNLRQVSPSAIHQGLTSAFPSVRYVGDKFPGYIWKLNVLTQVEKMQGVIIYRDCRDVVNSTLGKAKTDWQNKKFAQAMDTIEKISTRWVRGIELMEAYADQLLIIRYEDLVSQPSIVVNQLADYLQVDPRKFDYSRIHTSSVSKYEATLSAAEIEEIHTIAGSTLQRLGY